MSASSCSGNCIQASSDGMVKGQDNSHAGVRGASVGTQVSDGDTDLDIATGYTNDNGTYHIWRSFFAFDTSAISTTVTSATLWIHGKGNGADDMILVKSTIGPKTTLTTANYNDLDFSTPYSSEITSWNASQYNQITLNAAARTAMQSGLSISFALINYSKDYNNSAGSNKFTADNGCYYTDHGTKKPELGYAVAAASTPITLSSGTITISSGLITIT